MSNIFSLHQELQNATEQYENYLNLKDCNVLIKIRLIKAINKTTTV